MGSEMFDYLRYLSLFCPSTRAIRTHRKLIENLKTSKWNEDRLLWQFISCWCLIFSPDILLLFFHFRVIFVFFSHFLPPRSEILDISGIFRYDSLLSSRSNKQASLQSLTISQKERYLFIYTFRLINAELYTFFLIYMKLFPKLPCYFFHSTFFIPRRFEKNSFCPAPGCNFFVSKPFSLSLFSRK